MSKSLPYTTQAFCEKLNGSAREKRLFVKRKKPTKAVSSSFTATANRKRMKSGTKGGTKSRSKGTTVMLTSGKRRRADQQCSMSSKKSKSPGKLLAHHWNGQNILYPTTKQSQTQDHARFQGPGVVLAQATSPTVVKQLTDTQQTRRASERYRLQIQSMFTGKRTTRLLVLSLDQSLASRNRRSRNKAERKLTKYKRLKLQI